MLSDPLEVAAVPGQDVVDLLELDPRIARDVHRVATVLEQHGGDEGEPEPSGHLEDEVDVLGDRLRVEPPDRLHRRPTHEHGGHQQGEVALEQIAVLDVGTMSGDQEVPFCVHLFELRMAEADARILLYGRHLRLQLSGEHDVIVVEEGDVSACRRAVPALLH